MFGSTLALILVIVSGLLGQKSDVNARSADGSTALLWAAHWNDVNAADLLLRSGADAWQFIFLPLAHLSFICGLMWVYTHTPLKGSVIRQGVFLGFLAWLMGQVPLWLIWYAEQPWPGSLVMKQLGLELVSSILIGLTIAVTAPRNALRSERKMSPGEDSAAATLAVR